MTTEDLWSRVQKGHSSYVNKLFWLYDTRTHELFPLHVCSFPISPSSPFIDHHIDFALAENRTSWEVLDCDIECLYL